MSSIRGFLITLLLAIILLTVFLTILQGYQASNKEIQQQMDARLIDMAHLLSSLHINNDISAMHAGDKFIFQIFTPEENLLHYSTIASEQRIAPLKQEFNEVNYNSFRWRSYGFFNTQNKHWIIVAERIDIRFDLAEKIILKSLMPIVLGVPLAALFIWFAIGYALKPLTRLSNALKNKRENDLSVLQIKQPFSEVEDVIQSSNSLLKRLTLSFEREKRFASDVAHELRTPLSVLKIDIFNLTQSLDKDDKNVQALNQGVDRMEHLVQQILTLYRTTPDQFMAKFISLDLVSLAQKVIAEHYDSFENKSQSIELQGESGLMDGDQSSLEILLVNLLQNANKYTPEGGSINVSISEQNDSVILEVEDSGVGIVEENHERVFERFYRVDGDCHASNEVGSGIGLSIVKHIIDLHKASISLKHSSFETGLMVRVVFPKGRNNG